MMGRKVEVKRRREKWENLKRKDMKRKSGKTWRKESRASEGLRELLRIIAEVRIEKEFMNKPKERIDPEEWSLQETE